MGVSHTDVDQVKQRLIISKVIGEYVRLVKKGRYLYGLCPFHKEKTPSFSVSDERGFFYCFGCGIKGDVLSFVMRIKHVDFKEALAMCAQKVGMPIKELGASAVRHVANGPLDLAKKWFQEQLAKHPEVRKYLSSRFQDKTLLSKFGIGYAPGDGALPKYLTGTKNCKLQELKDCGLVSSEGFEYFKQRIVFPIKDVTGQVLGFGGRKLPNVLGPKYLNSPESTYFHKRSVLYAIDLAINAIRSSGSIIVVEGYTDVIALHEFGFCNAVASLGTAITEHQVSALLDCAMQVSFCFDGDQSGRNAAVRAIKVLLPRIKVVHDIRFVSLDNSTDPCDFLQKEGRVAFESRLNLAVMLSEFIWNLESGGEMPILPEYQAKLEIALMRYVELISDRDLRKYYKLYFLRRIRAQGYKNWSNAAIKYIPDIRLDHEYLVIRIVTDFPEILNRPGVQEQFMDFELEECFILQDLVSNEASEGEISKEILENKVREANCESLLLKVRLRTQNYQIPDYENAVKLWQRILTISEINALEKEYSDLIYKSMEEEGEFKRASTILDTILQLKSKIRNYDFAL